MFPGRKRAYVKAPELKGSQKCWQNREGPKNGLCVKGKSQPSRDGGIGLPEGLSSKLLKSNGISLKGVMQLNDIIRFLFSRGHSGKHVGKRPAWLWGGM